ncbi:DUF4157 domain-containing protein [Amycolatopsis sp. cg13]|uniref:DUF4157 domain-containing protein n=1 Tax=Amycolatopsis sp. cg13 TaxID=3238807 RepID=UPI0035244BE6
MRAFARQTNAVPESGPERRRAPQLVHEAVSSAGHPLDSGVRAYAQDLLGWDFSRVRVHSDVRAAESARQLGARAYTVGDHVVCPAENYRPGTADGNRLLLHELAHVVQQRGAAPGAELGVGAAGHGCEREADAVADGTAAPGALTTTGAVVQRQISGLPLPPGPPPFTPAAPITWTPIVGETPLTFSSLGAAAARSTAAPLAEGVVSAGGTALGEGSLLAGASTSAVVVEGGAIVADGAVVVGGAVVAEGTVVTGGTVVAAAAAGETAVIGGTAAVGGAGLAALALPALVLIGAVLIVAGTVYLVVNTAPEESAPPAEAPGQDNGAPVTDPGPVTPAAAPGKAGRGPVVDPVRHPPAVAPPPRTPRPVRLAGHTSRENEALVQRMRALKGRNTGLSQDWDGLEQRLRDADPAVSRAAADELGRLEIEDYQHGPRAEPAPADTSDIDAQERLYRKIAKHSWEHSGHREDLTRAGVRSVREATQLIGEIMARAGSKDWYDRLAPGQEAEAVIDRKTGLIVIVNGPDIAAPGTMFQPDKPPDEYLGERGFTRRK